MKNSVKSLSSGRSFLPLLRPRPLPILFVTGGGYLGYQHYRINSPKEDGAPPTLATPTQVGTPFSLGNFFRRELFSFSLCVALFLSPGFGQIENAFWASAKLTQVTVHIPQLLSGSAATSAGNMDMDMLFSFSSLCSSSSSYHPSPNRHRQIFSATPELNLFASDG